MPGLIVVLAIALALLAAPNRMEAHAGGEPFIHVPVERILPSEPFPLIAADLGPDSVITIEIVRDGRAVTLGSVPSGPEGHFETTLELPAGFAHGYAELIASGSDGSRASAWVLVGDSAEAAVPPAGQPAWWAQPSMLVLAGLVVAVLIALGYLLVRSASRRQGSTPSGGP